MHEEWKDAPRNRHRNGSKHRGTRQRAFMARAQRADGHDRPPQSKMLFTPDISKKDPSEPFWMNKQISCGQASWCQEARRCFWCFRGTATCRQEGSEGSKRGCPHKPKGQPLNRQMFKGDGFGPANFPAWD